MKMRYIMISAATGLLIAAGCGQETTGGALPAQTASATMLWGGIDHTDPNRPSFKGNSVYLKGERLKVTDTKYPCENILPGHCYKFNEAGEIADEYGKVKVFEDLCPSTDFPQADWKFDYTVYADGNCTNGYEITDSYNTYNFVCYNADDIFTQRYPNTTIESLEPGQNCNEVICVTENASKSWDFDVCVDESEKVPPCFEDRSCDATLGPVDYDRLRTLKLDCGCYEKYGKCVCDQDITSLPLNCSIETENQCKVVCTPQTVGVRYRSFGNLMTEPLSENEIWLGLRDLSKIRTEKSYVWTSGQTPVTFTYDPWGPTGPVIKTVVDGQAPLTYNLPQQLEKLDSLQISIKNSYLACWLGSLCRVEFKDVYLGTTSLGNFSGTGNFKFTNLGAALKTGFTIKGKIDLAGVFDGQPDAALVEISVGQGF